MAASKRLTPARLKALRRQMRLSAREVAAALRYSRSYIKRMEGGSAPITAEFCRRWAAWAARRTRPRRRGAKG